MAVIELRFFEVYGLLLLLRLFVRLQRYWWTRHEAETGVRKQS